MSDSPNEIRDELPSDLNVSAFVGPYKFPDNSRRRIPGLIYLVIAALSFSLWVMGRDSDSALVSDGFFGASILLTLVGLFSLSSA
ncbi:MAG: hypothetical protein EBQ64_05165, partial [Acidimicrobiia bacterium]|nr:hypothetical protein [Acidimicrobiia bacterium]